MARHADVRMLRQRLRCGFWTITTLDAVQTITATWVGKAPTRGGLDRRLAMAEPVCIRGVVVHQTPHFILVRVDAMGLRVLEAYTASVAAQLNVGASALPVPFVGADGTVRLRSMWSCGLVYRRLSDWSSVNPDDTPAVPYKARISVQCHNHTSAIPSSVWGNEPATQQYRLPPACLACDQVMVDDDA